MLLKFGGGVVDARGSIGGTTFSRCAGGNYARARTKPVNPRSETQIARRANVAYLTTYWSKTLTEQQRIDWRAYATGTTWHNKLGETININGLAAFLRLNALRRMDALSVIDEAPLAMGHAGGAVFTFEAWPTLGLLHMAEPTGAFDAALDENKLWIFQGLPTEAGRISNPKGMKYNFMLYGSSAAPLTFPFDIATKYTFNAGQRITLKAMFQDENYRVSGPEFAHAIAADPI